MSLQDKIDRFNAALGKLVSWFTLLMALLTFLIVLLRYGFNLGWIAMQEAVVYLHAAVFLLGAAYTFQHDGHVRVDVFYRRFTPRNQAKVNLFGAICLMLPMCGFITFSCWHYVWESWYTFEGSKESGGLPFLYVLKSFLLVFSITLSLQAIADFIKQVFVLTNNTAPPLCTKHEPTRDEHAPVQIDANVSTSPQENK